MGSHFHGFFIHRNFKHSILFSLPIFRRHTAKMSEAKAPSAEELAAKAGALKKGGDTKESDKLAVDPAAVDAMKKLYDDNGGDIDKLAAATGCDKALMEASKPSDAADFASKVLSGKYAA